MFVACDLLLANLVLSGILYHIRFVIGYRYIDILSGILLSLSVFCIYLFIYYV